jgi:hypothetical protein
MKKTFAMMILLGISFNSCKTFHLEGGNYIPNEIIMGGANANQTIAPYLGYAAISPKANSNPLTPYNKADIKFQPGYFMLDSNPGLMNNGKIIPIPTNKKAEILAAILNSYEFDIGATLQNTEAKKSIFDQQIQALQGNSSSSAIAALARLTENSKSLNYQIELLKFFRRGSNSISIKMTDIHNYYQLDPSKYKVSKDALNKICKNNKIIEEEPNAYISEIYEISGTLEFKSESLFSAGLKANFATKMAELKKTIGTDGSVNLKYDSSEGDFHKFTITHAWMLFNTRTISNNDCPKI